MSEKTNFILNIYKLNYFTDINPELKRISEDGNEVNIIFNLKLSKKN